MRLKKRGCTLITVANFKPTALALAISLSVLGESQAATINVDMSCSLNDSIISANTNSATGGCNAGDVAGTDNIVLPASTTFSILNAAAVYQSSLSISALPIISSDISIQGNGSTIERMAGADPFRIIYIDTDGTLALSSMTISGGYATGSGPGYNFTYGGGIRNRGDLVLDNVTVSNSIAERRGGGISNRGSLTLNNSTISLNTALGMGGGGISSGSASFLQVNNSLVTSNTAGIGAGIEGYFGETVNIVNSSITLNGSSLSNAQGGATSISNTNVSITGSTISGNDVGINGSRAAGVQVFDLNGAGLNSLVILNSTITSNLNGDGVYSTAYTKVEGSSITLNGGNGIKHRASGISDSIFSSLTVTGNAEYGVYTRGAASSLVNSTLSNNGTGLRVQGTSSLLQDLTIYSNSTGGGGSAAVAGEINANNLMVDSNASSNGNIAGLSISGDIISLSSVTATNNSASSYTSLGGLSIGHSGNNPVTADVINVSNNTASGGGGGLVVGGTVGVLTLTNTVVTGNSAGGSGGGVLASGNVILDGIDITNNHVAAGANTRRGGGIYVGSSAANNVSLLNSFVRDNTSDQCAGVCVLGGSLTIHNSTISGNADNFISLTNAAGGGIFIGDNVPASVTDSAITGNKSATGGGIYMRSKNVELVNLTISGNTATDQGGAGISVSGIQDSDSVLTLTNGTVFDNVQAGAFGVGGVKGPLELMSSVVAGNVGDDCNVSAFPYSSPVIGDNNWFEDDTCNGVAQGVPLLGVLGDNGGDTFTHMPQIGSGLIDKGGQCGLEFDQIGSPRSVCACDVGAFEVLELDPDNSSCLGSFFVVPIPNGNSVIFEL